MVCDLQLTTSTESMTTDGASSIMMPPPVLAKPLVIVKPEMSTFEVPAMVNPLDASAQSTVVCKAPPTVVISTSADPRVDPHDVACTPGRSNTVRVAAVEEVAAKADGMESHGASHDPHEAALEADEDVDTISLLRASSMGTLVGEEDSLAAV